MLMQLSNTTLAGALRKVLEAPEDFGKAGRKAKALIKQFSVENNSTIIRETIEREHSR
jgi:hypothetical protein